MDPGDKSSSQTFTFLFADIEGSTRLWEQHPSAMKAALARHDAILRSAVEDCHGHVVKTTGDGLMAVFVSALDGLNASIEAQRGLCQEPWGATGPLLVRMGLHTGEAQPRGGDYYGPAVNRTARLMSAAHGGQVILSSATAGLLLDLLPPNTGLRDLGEHRLRDLARPEHIYQVLHPGLHADFAPLATLDLRPNNLPAQPTALVGREAELAEITSRLRSDDVHLLTLTGPGGIGKTRTALQAAAELVDGFEDGVYFVDLAPIRDAEAVLPAIAHTLGLRETGERPLSEELQGHLRTRSTLLLLDNFEQVVQAAPSVLELLRAAPHLKLLVTSREPLHVRGEHVFPLPPLALPRIELRQQSIEQLTQYEAVRLFITCAQAVKPDFQVTNENAPAVAEICVRLDGLPLAIELAAARIRLFSPQALLERLGSRLKLLRGGARDLPERQQALRSAIDWSYDLLEQGEQRQFELLSVFAGGTSFDAAEGVAETLAAPDAEDLAVLDALASLVDKSLVRQVDRENGEPRLLMLETIREYAAERLASDPAFHAAARRAHGDYFAAFAERQGERLTADTRDAALHDLGSEIENVRAAWRYWAGERDLGQLGRFVDSLWRFYDARGWYEAMIELTNDMLKILSATPSTPEQIQQEILLQIGLARALLVTKGYTQEVEQAYRRALELIERAGDIPQMFPVLRGLASVYNFMGQWREATEMGQKILELAERLDDGDMRMEGHLVVGYNTAYGGNMQTGMAHLEQAIAGYDPDHYRMHRFQSGNNPGVVAYNVSALLLWAQGFPDRALQRAIQGVALASQLSHPFSMAYAVFHRGVLHLFRREPQAMQECAGTVLAMAEEHEFQVWQAVATCLDAAAMSALGRPNEGIAQVNRGMHLYQGLRTPPAFWPLLLQMRATIYGQLGQPEQGLASLEEAFALVAGSSSNVLTPDFCVLKGSLLLDVSAENRGEAERWFQLALDVARQLQLATMELRAAIALDRLWREVGKADEGRQVLRCAYDKLTEGFATPDVLEARELLEGSRMPG